MKKLLKLSLYLLLSVSFIVCAEKKKPVTIVVALGGGESDEAANNAIAEKFNKEHTDIQVKLYKNPMDTNETFALYTQIFEAKSGNFDVMQVDIAWFGSLAGNLADLKGNNDINDLCKELFPHMVSACNIDNKLIAVPWYAGAGGIFYRKDLLKKYNLEVPSTWQELTKTAYIIQQGERKAGNQDFVGFIFQGKAYEGLTCNALEWIHSFGGGRILSEDKKVTLDNPKAVAALQMASKWVGTISPRGVTLMDEDKSLLQFNGGNAAFLRSWPYVYSLAQEKGSPVKDKVGVMTIPSTDPKLREGIGSFECLAVNKYSKHKKEAEKVLLYFSNKQALTTRVLIGGLCPPMPSIYKDKEILKKRPELSILFKLFEHTFRAPQAEAGAKYNIVSTIFYKAVSSVLRHQKDAATAVAEAAKQISNETGFPLAD
jgi:trehalose/maltose transport system substrate-binding protein